MMSLRFAAEETIAETLYRKNAAGNGVAEATGLKFLWMRQG